MDRFTNYLREAHTLQTETFGLELPLDDSELSAYLALHGLAAFVELGEVMQEVGWKPWKASATTNRDKCVDELIDALHFVANMLVGLEVDDAELSARYEAKSAVNRERQRTGY